MLHGLRQPAVQAASDPLTTEQRTALQEERHRLIASLAQITQNHWRLPGGCVAPGPAYGVQ